MGLRINTNVSALNALRNLGVTADETQRTIQRLSTGLRINQGADDPAGLMISEGLRAQIGAMQQASRNSQDAINLAKTAEAALDEVQRLLKSARTLSVHAANSGVNDAGSVQADQTQIRSICEAINRISTQTQFGTKKLLDGTSGVSAALSAPSWVSAIQLSGSFGGMPISSGTVSMHRISTATKAHLDGGTAGYTAGTVVASGSVVVNGVTITTSNQTVTELVQKINSYVGQTGVLATFDSVAGTIDLDQQTYGGNFKIELQDSSSLIHSSSYTSIAGVNARYSVITKITNSDGTSSNYTVAFDGGRNSSDSGLKLTDTYGNLLVLTEIGNSISTASAVGLAVGGNLQFQVGANANQTAMLSLSNVHSTRLGASAVAGKSLSDIDLTTTTGANEAMAIVEDAINQISRLRGELGSFHRNVLESNVRAVDVAIENLSATESQIRDVDMASEVTQLTKLQILQQSGMAVLAQANQTPQSVLKLLQ